MRSVVGDESIQAAVEAIVGASARGIQVGVVLGRLGLGGRDFVLGLVPTPVKEDGADAAVLVQSRQLPPVGKSRAGANSSSSSLVIDADWVAEHARQVSRMLVGGVAVVGLYCLVSEEFFKQSTAGVCKVAKAIAENTPGASSDRIVLHIATTPRRLSCRVCSLEANGNFSLKPSEWRLGKLISNLHSLSCTYVIDASLPLFHPATDTFRQKLTSWIDSEAKLLEDAEALINDEMVQPDECLSHRNGGRHDVRMLVPFDRSKFIGGEVLSKASIPQPCDLRRRVLGTIKLKGTVHARAYAFPRETVSSAVSSIKEEISNTLLSRIELLCEEAEQSVQETSEPKEIPSLLSICSERKLDFTCSLPRRVFLPWNGLVLCDYVLPAESLKDVESRCKDLLGLNLDTASVVEPEYQAPASVFQELEGSAMSQSNEKGSRLPVSSLLLGALLATVLAMLIALLTVRRS